jgi:hypothetical protein
MSENKLQLEILTGPLDGTIVALDSDAEWSCIGEGPLIFPWDEELGEPQALFSRGEDGWQLEAVPSPHGTYRLNQGERVDDKVVLEDGDILKASHTWLFVNTRA